jgi:hypothetical protein
MGRFAPAAAGWRIRRRFPTQCGSHDRLLPPERLSGSMPWRALPALEAKPARRPGNSGPEKGAAVAVLVRDPSATTPDDASLNNTRRIPYLSRQAIESHPAFWTEIDPRVRRISYREQVAFERIDPRQPHTMRDRRL